MIGNDALARDWLGTPYQHQGTLKHVGVDCVGLLVGVAKEAGIIAGTYRIPPYEPFNNGELLMVEIARFCDPITLDERRPGDVLIFSFLGQPQHTAYVSRVGMIHSYAPLGKVVESPISDKWLDRIYSAWRPVGGA